jgi:hypothetical protein
LPRWAEILRRFHGSVVQAGFVASLNRPGGNLTGVVTLLVRLIALPHDCVRTLNRRPTPPNVQTSVLGKSGAASA